MIDAGSTGADDVDDFYQLTRKASTEVYALLNISRVGLIAQNELANMANIDAAAVKQAVQRHPDFYRRPEGADEQQRRRRKTALRRWRAPKAIQQGKTAICR